MIALMMRPCSGGRHACERLAALASFTLGKMSGMMMEKYILGNGKAISFAERLAGSQQFFALFNEGMQLVADATAYLDGEGRAAAKRLPRAAAAGYAIESMRLTTRLIQMAAWLLLQRAVNEGELTKTEAAAEKLRIRLGEHDSVSSGDVLALLPARLCALIESSRRLEARLIHLDASLYQKSSKRRSREKFVPNPVGCQIERLEGAFARQAGTLS